MRKFVISIFTIFVVVFALIAKQSVHAADFLVEVNRNYAIDENSILHIVETQTVKNNSKNLSISKDNTEDFQIWSLTDDKVKLEEIVKTAVVKVDGNVSEFSVEYTGKSALLKIKYPHDIARGKQMVFTVSYDDAGLVEQTGALIDFYIPGFAKDYSFTKDQSEFRYTTKVSISNNLPEINFSIPEPKTTEQSGNNTVYTYNQESLLGKSVWIELGKSQFYHFVITENAPATDSTNTGYMNEYRLVLPRDIDEAEISQKVFFTNFSTKPTQIVQDSEGNLVGYFRVPTHQSTTITIEGFAEVSQNKFKISEMNAGLISDVDTFMAKTYTNAAQYWEVNANEIQTKAKEILGTETNIYKVVAKTYQTVVDTIDYSTVKRFGLNERQGALKTLQGGAAVCMEYSDLFLTLSRAQGIPARAVFGYGYDPKLTADKQGSHQWVEVYSPGLEKWVSVDVTWGESGPALIGGDLNHFYTHVAAVNPDTPKTIERSSYGSQVKLDAPDYKIEVTKTLPQESLLSQADVLKQYPKLLQSSIQESIQKWINDNIAPFFNNIKNSFGANGSMLFLVPGLIIIIVAIVATVKVLRKEN